MKRRSKTRLRILLLCLFFSLISLPRLVNMVRQERLFQHYASEVKRLEQENTSLLERIEALNSDPYYTEKILRDNFGYIRDGEYVYRIKD